MRMDATGSKDDYTCPICMYILIYPVTMPCSHSLCMPCYKQCVEKTNLTCPLCRMRISSWARKQSRSNSLVDCEKWDTIQRNFPAQVKNRLEDKESSDEEWESVHDFETELRKRKDLSKPGAIRQEYEAAIAQLRRQQEDEKRKEEEASAALIRALQEEEEEEIAILERERELNEKKGIEVAIMLDREEHTKSLRSASSNSRSTEASSKGKSTATKPKRSQTSLKLDTFYEKIRRTSCSAPLLSERAPTPHKPNIQPTIQERELSPYPYICISPSDKYQENPSPSVCSSPEWNAPLEQHLSEHSYTTRSAGRVDLTSDSLSYMSCRRCDVLACQPIVKIEPPDIGEFSESDVIMKEQVLSFQPIESFLRTPPKQFPTGQCLEPSVIRAVPRNLSFNDGAQGSSSSTIASTTTLASQSVNSCVIDDRLSEVPVSHPKVHSETETSHPTLTEKSTERGNECLTLRCCKTKRPGEADEHNATDTASTSSSTSSASTHVKSVDGGGGGCNSTTKDEEDKDGQSDNTDVFITDDTPLLIPLEADLSVCNIENECDPLFIGSHNSDAVIRKEKPNPKVNFNTNKRPPMLQESNQKSSNQHPKSLRQPSPLKSTSLKHKHSSKNTTAHSSSSSSSSKSKSQKPPVVCNMSIRQFCVPTHSKSEKPSNSRKRKSSSDSFQSCDSDSIDSILLDENLDQEEADRLYAMQLQNLYSKLDKNGIQVDRYKGAKDEYLLRKRKCQ